MHANALVERQGAAVLEKYVDAPAISAALGIDRRSLRRLIVRGVFPPADLVLSQTLHRWKQSSVENWLAVQAQAKEATR